MAKTKGEKNPAAKSTVKLTQLNPPLEGSCSTRVCVPAPMPVQCPQCRSSKTTAANGVHYNMHFGTRYEHRICGACGYSFTASRRMTAEELARQEAKNG